MELLRILLSRCAALFRERALDEDLEDELHSHVDFAAFLRGANIQINISVIAVALAAGVLSSMAAGLIPAWRATRSDPNQALKSGIATGTTQRQNRLRASFVITQIALSLVLVVFAGLLMMTLRACSRSIPDSVRRIC